MNYKVAWEKVKRELELDIVLAGGEDALDRWQRNKMVDIRSMHPHLKTLFSIYIFMLEQEVGI